MTRRRLSPKAPLGEGIQVHFRHSTLSPRQAPAFRDVRRRTLGVYEKRYG
mgnify:CR=1 FL=1